MAALGEGPFAQFTAASMPTPRRAAGPPLLRRTGDEETLAELWPSDRSRAARITGRAIPTWDGFCEDRRESEQGLANQGWKDSYDSIFHAERPPAEGYIALAECRARFAGSDWRRVGGGAPRKSEVARKLDA